MLVPAEGKTLPGPGFWLRLPLRNLLEPLTLSLLYSSEGRIRHSRESQSAAFGFPNTKEWEFCSDWLSNLEKGSAVGTNKDESAVRSMQTPSWQVGCRTVSDRGSFVSLQSFCVTLHSFLPKHFEHHCMEAALQTCLLLPTSLCPGKELVILIPSVPASTALGATQASCPHCRHLQGKPLLQLSHPQASGRCPLMREEAAQRRAG